MQGTLQMAPVLMNCDRIAGNFGEMRGNHFHSGLDFKTNEKEGKPVFAAADGYISRIKVSANGYGRAIYITHPNDIVTVYGHLRIFYPALEDTLRKLQFKAMDYEIEIFPDSGLYQVRSGTVIGYSGNSGSSKGPHLHFETRYRNSEKPFNPDLAGYRITDTIPPQIRSLAFYSPGPANGLAGSSRQILEISPESKGFKTDTLVTGDHFFAGFEAFDKAGMEENHLGIRSCSLFLDDSLVFTMNIDSFSFDETRMVNASIDYPYYTETGRKIVLCHSLKGNRLSFFENKNGVIYVRDSRIHKLKLRVEDSAGNITETGCHIRKNSSGKITMCHPEGLPFLYGNPGKIGRKHYSVEISPLSFYEDVWFECREKTVSLNNKMPLAPVVSIGPAGIAVHEPLTVTIKPYRKRTDPVSKLTAVQIDSNGHLQGIPSKYDKGRITFKTRSMGDFSVALDTTPPTSKSPTWQSDDYSGKQKLIIEITDNLSGISSVKCFINEKWTPAVYNSGTNRLVIYPEELPDAAEPFTVRLDLFDKAGNQSKFDFSVTFMR